MPERRYSYGRQLIGEDDIQAVVDVLRRDRITQGPAVREFEERLSERFGARCCAATSSGTASLHLIAAGLGWKPGDIVITSPMTFVATANCIVYVGATPDFADIDPVTYTLDPAKVEERILRHQSEGRTVRAVIGVDYAGHPCDWDGLLRLATQYDVQLVNDHCHAMGSVYRGEGQFAAKYADAVSLSFHPVKHVTTGEGGAVLTRHQWLDERIKSFRSHGVTKDPRSLSRNDGPWYYEMREPGFNYRITDMQCALGISQLPKLDGFLQQRRMIAAFYDRAFAGHDWLTVPAVRDNCRHAYHLYPLQLEISTLKVSKSELFDRLGEKGIHCQVHYIPVHLQPFYREKYGFREGDFPVAEEFYRRELSIPIYPGLSTDDLEYISSELMNAVHD